MLNTKNRKTEKRFKHSNIIIALAVASVFAFSLEAATVTWTGGDADNPTDWFAGANWDGAAVPVEGDDVVVPSGAKVTISNSTPVLASIEVSGTLVFTNWMTRLNATGVTVMSDGILTCAGPFIPGEMSNRVWVACGDLTVLRGGRIHADAKGYKGGNTAHKDGYGPGAIPGESYYGAGGHGGIGSYKIINHVVPRAALATNEYGCASAPVTPGSGGWGGNGAGGAGGGVVTIDASGIVEVYGSITADAQGSISGWGSSGGSGGSVFITSRTFRGAYGRISARGGVPFTTYAQEYHAGGGGRVAVLFDKTEQAKLPCPEGMYYGADTGGFLAPEKARFMDCLPGSLYFSSDTLIDRTGATLFGKLDFADITDKWTVDSVRLTNGWVMMARDDVEVEVLGDLEVTGDTLVSRRYNSSTGRTNDETRGTRWDVGGTTLYIATNALHVYRKSSAAPRLTVNGDLKVNDYGLFYVYPSEDPLYPSASTPATTNLGAQVTVAGAIVLEDIGKMYVKSHPRTGVSPSFSAGSLIVDETSWIDANDKGFFGSNSDSFKSVYTRSFAPETAAGKDGGSHGGAGGSGRESTGAGGPAAFDSLEWPVMCGSSGNCDYQGRYPGLGGGVIRFFISGEANIDGTLRANATSAPDTFCGSAAGGTVLVVCDHIIGKGSVEAKGRKAFQHVNAVNGYNGGGGGGGRVAVHYNRESQSNVACRITFNVSGGVGVGDGVYSGSGEPGTIWFTDDTVIAEGKSHSGRLYAPERINFVVGDSLTIEDALTTFDPGGYVRIENDLVIRGNSAGSSGFEIPKGYFHVGGNLIIEGGHVTVTGDAENPRSDMFRVGGNVILSNASITIECSDEDRDQLVSIGGSLVLTNASTITLKSPCDEVEGEPGLVFTAQKLQMFEDCWVCPWSHNTNGASVLVRIPEIRCTGGSGFDANAKGYGRLTGAHGPVYGPVTTRYNGAGAERSGGNATVTIASGHGGDGGSAKPVSETYPRGVGLAFGDRLRPVFPGPGGAGGYQVHPTPRGGGVIRIESTFFDLGGGTLTANGGSASSSRTGGAGGSIYVTADRFIGNGGFLYANGGAGSSTAVGDFHKTYCFPGGGGGRIAVYFRNSSVKAMDVTASAKGGACHIQVEAYFNKYGEDLTELKAERDGKDGTIHWGGPRGMRVIVR